VVSKDPFPARACLQDGSVVDGVLIGETSDRTYLGEPAGAHPRRVISSPESQIALVSGPCPETRPQAARHRDQIRPPDESARIATWTD
jgi:hypothetical protein